MPQIQYFATPATAQRNYITSLQNFLLAHYGASSFMGEVMEKGHAMASMFLQSVTTLEQINSARQAKYFAAAHSIMNAAPNNLAILSLNEERIRKMETFELENTIKEYTQNLQKLIMTRKGFLIDDLEQTAGEMLHLPAMDRLVSNVRELPRLIPGLPDYTQLSDWFCREVFGNL